jgi:predicted O-linked N-acetylglucosamine transferase (SPINDLY family)
MLQQAVNLQNAGHIDAAEQMFRKALIVDPKNFDANHLLGILLCLKGQLDRGVVLLQKSVEIDPRAADAWLNLGHTLKQLTRMDEALAAYRTCVTVHPRHKSGYLYLGVLFAGLGRDDEAEPALRRALEIDPRSAEAAASLATVLERRGQNEEALALFEKAVTLDPRHEAALTSCIALQGNFCEWSTLAERAARLLAIGGHGQYRARPFRYLSLTDDPAIHLAAARASVKSRGSLGTPFPPKPAVAKDKLRIGYVSTDFREHPVAYLIPELIERHDRAGFEIIGLSAGADDGSAFRRRLAAAFDTFDDVSALDAPALGRHLHEANLDILVELNGHTATTRLPILELRPAPIQVSWLGYPATTGAPYVDYTFVDRFLVPPGHEGFFSEALAFLPDSFQVNDRRRAVAQAKDRASYGLPADAFVFCCFNGFYKINPQTFHAWMRILKAVDGSVLWLRGGPERTEANLMREAEARGVDPARLVFAPREPYPSYLARYTLADLALDTWPYNAGTTASDALWMGLPLVTLSQRSMTSRMAGSFLTALGLPELIATSADDYVDRVSALARDRGRLADVRTRLIAARDHGPFFDAERFARHVEAAYHTMWARHVAGERPASFAVPPIS